MILHLIRHPKPMIEAGICYGRSDLPAAIESADLARLRTELPPGLPVWSSPLQRCRVLSDQLHAQPIIDDRLAEMNFGHWEGRPWDEIPRSQLDAWAADIANYAPPGGESPTALQQRALAFVAGLTVPEAVMVTHAGVIRMLLAHWLGLPPARWNELQFEFSTVTTVSLTHDSADLIRLNR
ncbi:alpha-ribazole phosphatase family protein [Dechloromonas sp. HYN0024]|uniref:alpha-ribazole phosphatase family protein n=1 Tax=Dechloromonas sp. HYN0024 TaxID=2231055 RepID=UPI000E43901D|nr:alpha-ribazole phosphatase family protein [Dechloromonas sp. HYN0024]AXS78699.1 phosphoglycerate mutase [Dechloromonas sp. HYN0024]